MNTNSKLCYKDYVAGFYMPVPFEGTAGEGEEPVTLEMGTLKQLGTVEDYCTVSYPKTEINERVAREVALPIDDLKLSSILNSTEATREYVATTDNKKLALSQLVEAIKSKKSGEEREDYLREVFSAKKVDQWVEYIKEIVGEISQLKSQIEAKDTEIAPDDSDLKDITKLAENLTSLRSFSRQYCARWTVDISEMVDAYNESMPEVETFLKRFKQS